MISGIVVVSLSMVAACLGCFFTSVRRVLASITWFIFGHGFLGLFL